MDEGGRLAGQRIEEGLWIRRKVGDHCLRRGACQAIPGVPAGQQALGDGVASRTRTFERWPADQGETLAERTPRPAIDGTRRQPLDAAHRGEAVEDAVERLRRDRGVPVEEDVGEVRHQDSDLVRRCLPPSPEIAGADSRGQLRTVGGEPCFTQQGAIVRRPGDPVAGRRIPLEDEGLAVPAPEAGQRCARPAVVRKRHLDSCAQAVPLQEVAERLEPFEPLQPLEPEGAVGAFGHHSWSR